MGGRIAFGLLGDRFGAKRVLVLGLLAQAFGALGYVFVRELAAFYAVAALFGFIYAGTMPLYAVLARENFPLRMMGTVIGGTAMAGSLGMATGPLAGGLIYDTFASYAWLYIGSWISHDVQAGADGAARGSAGRDRSRLQLRRVGSRSATHRFACVIACRVFVGRRGGLRFANSPYGLTHPPGALQAVVENLRSILPNCKIGRARHGRQRLA